MVSASAKRKRRQRENRTAALIEQAREQKQAEQKTLGTSISASVPNETLFKLDRKGTSKEALAQKHIADAIRERQATKRAQRKAPRPLRSEHAATDATPMEDVSFAGRKKQREIAPVEKHILKTRSFDKPEGHVGNKSAPRRAAKRHVNGREDVWNSETAERVKAEISESRKNMVRKVTRRTRRAAAVLFPDAGLSVNPSYEHHQDKLGEALSRIVEEEDFEKRIDDKLSYDPAILEAKDGVEAVTGMKIDATEITAGDGTAAPSTAEEDVEESDPVAKAPSERKSRTQRNKEKRERAMKSNIVKKKLASRQEADYTRLSAIMEEVADEADKLNGVTKRMEKMNRPRVPSRKDRPVLMKIAKQRVRNERVAEPFLLSTEVADSLRATKVPAANPLLQDRLLSFERRGIIEPPSVLPKEIWRMQQEKTQEANRDRAKRKGKHSKSKLTFWKERSSRR